jgi:D-lactate dehydrogenase
MTADPTSGFEQALRTVLPDGQVLIDAVDRLAYASDASVYRLVPKGVARPTNIDEVKRLFRFSHQHRVPITFRAAGTSLSGQAVTDGILVDAARHWRSLEVLDEGTAIRCQPGVIAAAVNRTLAPYQKKIGPDPASINACMMGGVLANNSSGMCCGVELNAYHTLDSMVFVLPDGTTTDSAAPDCEERFLSEVPHIAAGLLELRDRVRANSKLCEKIRHKYRMKNTMGYSLNAFLDYDSPVAMLTHLMIGSEGTLGFIAEAVLRTIPDCPLKRTGMLFFNDVPSACSAILPLRDSGARTLELMDHASLVSVQHQPGVPQRIPDLPPTAAALLVEYQADTEDELSDFLTDCDQVLPALSMQSEPIFTRDPVRQDNLWSVRKGLIASVGAARKRGTSMIIEDVVFPLEALAEGVGVLQDLFTTHRYDDAIIFGHAKDGNLHFVLNQGFGTAEEVARFDTVLNELAQIVAVRYGGALKGEHGTGRNMAPFLELEWGAEAVTMMREIKYLIDPENLLNPGVLINDNPQAHITDLKALETVEEPVDPCIECGFCERLCPSRDLTRTPRQRIVLQREITRLRREEPKSPLLRELEKAFQYSALDTCAADGLCATGCPVGIDTGQLIKMLRELAHPWWRRKLAGTMARHFGAVERLARGGLRLAGLTGLAPADLPRAARGGLPKTLSEKARAVYFPCCVSRVFAPVAGNRPLAETVVQVCRRAGIDVWIPDGIDRFCCGMPFGSKGYREASVTSISRLVESLWEWTGEGRLPVVVDTSPCAYTLGTCGPELEPDLRSRYDQLQILDGIEFALEEVVPGLTVHEPVGAVALHPVCSTVKMGLQDQLVKVVQRFCQEAVIPASAGCCGFAGDRGFLVPELTKSATAIEADEIRADDFDGFYSSSRTCEIGMTRATDRPYRSFWYLLEEATRGGKPMRRRDAE